MDVSFIDFSNLFGIPERINNYQVISTVKVNDDSQDETEPYRLFTCDHFNEKYPNHSTYGVVPILHARKENANEMIGFYWCNAADTYVDIIEKDT